MSIYFRMIIDLSHLEYPYMSQPGFLVGLVSVIVMAFWGNDVSLFMVVVTEYKMWLISLKVCCLVKGYWGEPGDDGGQEVKGILPCFYTPENWHGAQSATVKRTAVYREPLCRFHVGFWSVLQCYGECRADLISSDQGPQARREDEAFTFMGRFRARSLLETARSPEI